MLYAFSRMHFPSPTQKGIRMINLFIADDDPILTTMLTKVFGRTGKYKVQATIHPHEVEKRVVETGPDLLLMDVFLGGICGCRVVRSLEHRDELDGMVVAYMSAILPTEDIHSLACSRFQSMFFRKPLYLDDWLEIMVLMTSTLEQKIFDADERTRRHELVFL